MTNDHNGLAAGGNGVADADAYAIISPVRNEAEFVRRTLDSVVNQSLLPAQWVIVDDGSTDATPAILADYAARHPFIRIVTRADRGSRNVGGGVIEAFNDGFAALDRPTPYVCKLDMDLQLPPRYFETLVAEMRGDPRLGTVSGKAYFPAPANVEGDFDGPLISEQIADDVSVGASKFYRRAFLDDLGGLVQGVMWDGLDCYRGRMLGWRARSIDGPDLRFIHLRPMGSSDRGILTGRKRLGGGYWFIGASPLFVLASATYRLVHPPVLMGSLSTLLGYVSAALRRQPRFGDREFRRYLRRYHMEMLLRGRAAAVNRAEAEGAQIWARRFGKLRHS